MVVILPDDRESLVAVSHAPGDREIDRIGQMRLDAEHVVFLPLDEIGPHPADHDERRPIEPAHLQQLPDHQRFERRSDAAGHDDERVGEEGEMVQPREESAMLIRLSHEWDRLLLEVELDPNTDRLLASPGRHGAFVRSPYQPGPAASDDLAPHSRQISRQKLDLLVGEGAGLGSRRSEDRHSEALPSNGPKPTQVVHDAPEAEHGLVQHAYHRLFVLQSDTVRVLLRLNRFGHLVTSI
jgi:hypothetical protein